MQRKNDPYEQVSGWGKELAGAKLDMKDPAVLAQVRDYADRLLESGLTHQTLTNLEAATCAPGVKESIHNLAHLGVKLAKSKAAVQESPVSQISIILPAYNENTRMKPRGTDTGYGQDPLGEDFIVEKSKQLEWLFAETGHSYEVLIVDDMCKNSPCSGEAAQAVIDSQAIPHFQVLYLKDGVLSEKVGEGLVAAVLNGVEVPKNTKKAGAVYYGAAKAIERHRDKDRHVVVFTDCDLSVDVGQLGNLIKPIAIGEVVAVAGSRRLPESILEIVGSRNTRANAARYFREFLLKGLLPRDTQCGVKAFDSRALGEVLVSGMDVLDFPFDIELLTKFALRFGPDQVKPEAVAWFDSSELTTTDSSVHYNILKAQLEIAKKNRTGQGEVFDKAVKVSEKLSGSEAVWLSFLEELAAENNKPVLKGIETFDANLLDHLDVMVQPSK